MLCSEIIAVCPEINTLCGQNVEFLVFNLAVHIVTARVQRVKGQAMKRCWRLELNVRALLPLDRQ